MANITLWYKIAPSDTLGGVPSGQKIAFDDANAAVKYTWPRWGNLVKKIPNPNREGTRLVNIEDAGWDGFDALLEGYIKATEIVKSDNLFNFIKIENDPDALPFGRFSIDNPNGPKMTVEASATAGLSITTPRIVWNETNASYDFTIPLIFGGTFV